MPALALLARFRPGRARKTLPHRRFLCEECQPTALPGAGHRFFQFAVYISSLHIEIISPSAVGAHPRFDGFHGNCNGTAVFLPQPSLSLNPCILVIRDSDNYGHLSTLFSPATLRRHQLLDADKAATFLRGTIGRQGHCRSLYSVLVWAQQQRPIPCCHRPDKRLVCR